MGWSDVLFFLVGVLFFLEEFSGLLWWLLFLWTFLSLRQLLVGSYSASDNDDDVVKVYPTSTSYRNSSYITMFLVL